MKKINEASKTKLPSNQNTWEIQNRNKMETNENDMTQSYK